MSGAKSIVRPSALDSPRFFDDDPLSAWSVGGRQVAASKEDFKGAKAYKRGEASDSPFVDYCEEGDPIPIEIVRGADGLGDDSWTVLVDGIRCSKPSVADENGEFVFKLPRGVPLKVITQETQVRPVNVAVRLENEALAPLSCEVYLSQRIKSDERDAGDEDDVKNIGNRIPLQPYRTSDIKASAVTMPYPFWAPAQSALGILSLRPVNRHIEKEDAARAYNLWATVANGYESAAYNARRSAYDQLKAREITAESAQESIVLLAKLTNIVNPQDGLKVDQVKKLASTLKEPQRPTPMRPRMVKPRPSERDAESYVIGGKSDSVAKELTVMFTELVDVCESMRKQAEDAYDSGIRGQKKLSLREQLGAMRTALMLNNRLTDTLALFDALLDADPYPPASLLLNLRPFTSEVFTYDDRKNITSEFRREYFIREAQRPSRLPELFPSDLLESGAINPDVGVQIGADAEAEEDAEAEDDVQDGGFIVEKVPELQPAGDLSAEVRERLNEENTSFLKKESDKLNDIKNGVDSKSQWNGRDYMFVYERLTLEQRRRTTLRTRIHVEVAEFDGSPPLKLRFEAEEDDGIVAHAVYSEFRKDIDEFDIMAQKLVKCLFDVHSRKRGAFRYARDKLAESFEAIAARLFSKYAWQRSQRSRPEYFDNVFEISKYLTYGLAEQASRLISGTSPFLLDPVRTEERIAELRIMLRELLPIWPPMKTREPPVPEAPDAMAGPSRTPATSSSLEEADYVFPAHERVFDTVDVGVSGLDEFVDDYLKGRRELAKRAAQERKKADAKKTEAYIMKMNKQSDMLQKKIVEKEDDFSVVYEGLPQEDLKTSIVVRTLPQVVLPSKALSFAFKAYEFDRALIEVPPSSGEKWRFGSLIAKGASMVAVTALWSGVAGLGYLSYMQIFRAMFSAQTEEERAMRFAAYFPSVVRFGLNVAFTPFGSFQSLISEGNNIQVFSGLIGSLSDTTLFEQLGIGRDQFLRFVRAASSAVPFGVNLATWTLSFANRRLALSTKYAKTYESHKVRLIGKPTNSAVSAAMKAIQRLAKSNEALRSLSGTKEHVTVSYNYRSAKRFSFYEYYMFTDKLNDIAKSIPSVYSKSDWCLVPDANATRLFPPIDVLEKMYEVEELRGIPVSQTIEFTAGKGTGLSGTSTDLAAKSAYNEIITTVLRSRRILKGEHLMERYQSVGISIARKASAVLQAVYGSNAGITLVAKDDILWTCLRGGVAARLAMRHLPLFDNLYMEDEENRTVEQTVQYWRPPRRRQVDLFAKSMVDESLLYSKDNKMPYVVPQLKEIASEATRCFARVNTLIGGKPDTTSQEKSVVLDVIASSLETDLLRSYPQTTEIQERLHELLLEHSFYANEFKDQRDLSVPRPMINDESATRASWASKRISTSTSRNMNIGDGVTSIIEQLSGLQVAECSPSCSKSSYYCPVGSRPHSLPSRVPFSVDGLSRRMVWMTTVTTNATLLSVSLQNAKGTSCDKEECLLIQPFHLSGLKNDFTPTGISRHPLVIEQEGSYIRLPLSHLHSQSNYTNKPKEPASLVEALESIRDSGVQTQLIWKRIRRTRSIAFNSERFLYALSLCDAQRSTESIVEVDLQTHEHEHEDMLSLVIAMSCFEVETGRRMTKLRCRVADVKKMNQAALYVAEQANNAMAAGCRVCHLSELALTV